VIPDPSPNAFATGRNPSHSSVAVTAGVLELMNDRELEGIIAHELGHVKNRDILTSSIAATIAGAITYLAQMGQFAMIFGGRSHDDDDRGIGGAATGLLMLIVAPIAAMLIQMAISRTREFAADATAAKYSGTPGGLMSALRKLEGYSKQIPMDATPATAHMFIIQPFTGSSLMKMFSTHPPTAERIARLAALA
jgi:heat shock protein HtpX